MRLESFEINNTIYNISSIKKSNKVYVKKTTNAGVVTEGSIIVPDGYYTVQSLSLYLNSAGGPLDSIGVKLEFNETTLKSRFVAIDINKQDETDSILEVNFDYEAKCGESNIDKSQVQFEAPTERNINQRVKCVSKKDDCLADNKKEKRISTTSLGWLLGFRKEKNNDDYQHISQCFYDLNNVKYMFLCIDDFQKSLHEVVKIVYQDSFLEKNILARIPLDTDINNKFLSFHETDTVRKRNYFGPVNIKRMHIQLIDEYGQLVDLNNQDFSFNLEFEVLYERNI